MMLKKGIVLIMLGLIFSSCDLIYYGKIAVYENKYRSELERSAREGMKKDGPGAINNEKYTVRLVGVDTPESVHPNKEKNTKEGKIASDYTKSRLQDKNVYIQKDVSGTDRYRKIIVICIFRRWDNV